MNVSSEKRNLIFLGDTHNFLNDFNKQKELIERFKPKFILHEQFQEVELGNQKDFENVLQKKQISKSVKFEDFEDLIKLCNEKKIKIIGIDLQDFGLNKLLLDVARGNKEPRQGDFKLISKIQKKELNQIRKIKEYLAKTNESILVIIGTWHLREGSPLLKSFEHYRLIAPFYSNGKIATKPTKEKLTYKEIVKRMEN